VRVVLDSNVVIAALGASETCRRVTRHCIAGHKVVASNYILEEVRRNAVRKVRMPPTVADAVVDMLRQAGVMVEPAPVERGACRHANDLPVLGTAVAGDAHCLVTGDNDLLVLKSFRGVRIIRPAEFWRFEAEGAPRKPMRRKRKGT
jgi:putative PIN family toxin of toxin-antitoxin system